MAETKRTVEKWGMFEAAFDGPQDGNPFTDTELTAYFSCKNRTVPVRGFYDGDGTYKVRFMPDMEGDWSFTVESNREELNGHKGGFTCTPPSGNNHGPVRLKDLFHFTYEDGTDYYPVGTTCYVWNHQGEEMEKQTLETLKSAPFNKMRMCVFPKHHDFNHNEPEYYPFEGSLDKGWDFTRFNPEFFHHLEWCIRGLLDLGIECDLILFHPYDRWGYAGMDAESDDRYLRYVVARLASFRNMWWSMANEYDLMKKKSLPDWDRFFRIVQSEDPYQHLRSVHNCHEYYDHGKPWVTHCSIQNRDLTLVDTWQRQYKKPVVVDECAYEGTVNHGWGNITAEELTRRFWEGFCRGGYVGHGETYYNKEEVLWWSKGGKLHGESPKRIAFLRKILEEAPAERIYPIHLRWDVACAGVEDEFYLIYLGFNQPAFWKYGLRPGIKFKAEIIDTWNMTITEVPEPIEGDFRIDLPAKQYIALRLTKM